MKTVVFVPMLIVALLSIFAYQSSYSNEIKYTKLIDIPDNELATCRVKSNDFVFLCHLNIKTLYNCKFAIGTMFTPPVCKECDKPFVKSKTVLTPNTTTHTVPNPLLDAIRKMQTEKY